MNIRIVVLYYCKSPAIVGLTENNWHPLKTGLGSRPKPLGKSLFLQTLRTKKLTKIE